MSTEAAVAVEPATDPTDQGSPTDKSDIYARLASKANEKVMKRFEPVAKRVKEKHKEDINLRKPFGDDDGREMVVDTFFSLLALLLTPAADGTIVPGKTVGLPQGLGSFELLTAGATRKKTPQGQMIDVPERWRVKWNTGKAVSEMLKKLPAPPPAAATTATPSA